VDPPAIHLYQEYINYLKDVVIFNLRQELASALASPDPTSTNDDDGPVTGPMVVKTNTAVRTSTDAVRATKRRTTLHQQLHHLIQLHP
jgi:hypothetical protein